MTRSIAPAFFCAALLVSAWLSLRPTAGEAAIILFPPWAGPETSVAAVAAAGASLIDAGAGGRTVTAAFDDGTSLWRLYAAGAALVIRTSGRPCGSELIR